MRKALNRKVVLSELDSQGYAMTAGIHHSNVRTLRSSLSSISTVSLGASGLGDGVTSHSNLDGVLL